MGYELTMKNESVRESKGNLSAVFLFSLHDGKNTTEPLYEGREFIGNLKQQKRLAGDLAQQFGVDLDLVTGWTIKCGQKAREVYDSRNGQVLETETEEEQLHPSPQPGETSEVTFRREAALSLLNDPLLLYRISSLITRSGLMGEETGALSVYLAGTSRLLLHPISLIVYGLSATGKSTLAKQAAVLIPKEWRLITVGMSAKAALYMPDPWKNKLIIFLELPGMRAGMDVYRVMQTEGYIDHWTIDKDENGRNKAIHLEKEGPAAFLATTVETQLDDQEETRYWRISTDDSPEQTFRVTRSMILNHTNPPTEAEIRGIQDIQRILPTTAVAINQSLLLAVHELMEKKSQDPKSMQVKPRFRRDWGRIMAAVETSALLFQCQRERDDLGRIIPDLRDYYHVQKLMTKIFSESVFGIGPNSVTLYNVLEQRKQIVGAEEPMSQDELMRASKWSRTKVSLALKPLTEQGYVLQSGNGNQHGVFKYLPIQLSDVLPLPTLEEVLHYKPELAARLETMFDPVTGGEFKIQ